MTTQMTTPDDNPDDNLRWNTPVDNPRWLPLMTNWTASSKNNLRWHPWKTALETTLDNNPRDNPRWNPGSTTPDDPHGWQLRMATADENPE
jgi:hypothetical protein